MPFELCKLDGKDPPEIRDYRKYDLLGLTGATLYFRPSPLRLSTLRFDTFKSRRLIDVDMALIPRGMPLAGLIQSIKSVQGWAAASPWPAAL